MLIVKVPWLSRFPAIVCVPASPTVASVPVLVSVAPGPTPRVPEMLGGAPIWIVPAFV